jgi:hypothetical protein
MASAESMHTKREVLPVTLSSVAAKTYQRQQ